MVENGKKLTKEECELLKFEYQELREERKRNTYISYALMSILLLSSFTILGELFKGNIETYKKLAGILSSLLILIAWLIDRRLTYFNEERKKRMQIIEEELGIKNLLFGIGRKNYLEFIKMPQFVKNCLLKVPIHYFIFFIFIVITVLVYLILDC